MTYIHQCLLFLEISYKSDCVQLRTSFHKTLLSIESFVYQIQ